MRLGASLELRAAAAVVVAAVAFAAPATAQRLSLAERVERLEQQQANAQGGGAVDLVNQIGALQSQVQTLQGEVEELKHALDEQRRTGKDQYVDLSSRLERLEGGAASAPPPAPAAASPRGGNPPDGDLDSPANAPRTGSRAPGRISDLSDTDRAAAPQDAASAPPAGDPAAENAAYNDAFAALKDGRYAEAARRFRSFIDQYPHSELCGNAYYWLGESYYVTQNYPVAQQSFETLLERYPNSQKAPDALLKIGYSQYEQKQWDAAEATLNKVVRLYPDTTVARLAQGRLRALQTETRR